MNPRPITAKKMADMQGEIDRLTAENLRLQRAVEKAAKALCILGHCSEEHYRKILMRGEE